MSTSVRKRGIVVGALVSLLSVTVLYAAQKTSALGPDPQPSKHRISGPYTHANLSVFLIHGEDQLKNKRFLTLSEALAQKKIVVHETRQVNELAIENLSADEEVFIQA